MVSVGRVSLHVASVARRTGSVVPVAIMSTHTIRTKMIRNSATFTSSMTKRISQIFFKFAKTAMPPMISISSPSRMR